VDILGKYQCRIKLRTTHKGQPLRPKVKQFDGRVVNLECLWRCEEGERYAGEYAMSATDKTINDAFFDAGMSWIASGDVEVLPNFPEDGYKPRYGIKGRN